MEITIEKIISLCKRRGFIFPSSEIYGGFSSSYDFGPLGVEMKRNIKEAWWKVMVQMHENIVGLDAAILMSPKVWEASGHLTAGFADELVECKKCHKRFRLDEIKIKNEKSKIKNLVCPECGGELLAPRKFNLMMKTFVGPVEDESSTAYLRAETCQGIYVNFKNVMNSMRFKLPFGIAQIGKSFRNEITPKNFVFRTREFEQMEMQWFCHPKDADKWFEYWKEQRLNWYLSLGIKKENLRLVEIPEEDRAHYAKRQIDLEYKFPFGWQEIEGIHNRGDWDLSRHSQFSGEDLNYTDPETGEKFIPYVIETSVGVERSLLAFLVDAYQEVEGGRTKTTKATKEIEVVLRLHKILAPIKVAILPLVKNKPKLVEKTKEIFDLLKPHFMCQYDEVGSIGRRYRRQDEIGTPFCITIDFETLEKDDVTVRDRDTMEQERVEIKDLIEYLEVKLRE
ncbi:glycine--tRNA ligase [bacterium]|nr:glycine--tRNA ligase [bacterium]